METTIIKVGNSLGSCFGRAYLDKLGLKEGDKVEVTIKKIKPNAKKAVAALQVIAAMNGTLANLDVAAWQDERRTLQARKDAQFRDILGR